MAPDHSRFATEIFWVAFFLERSKFDTGKKELSEAKSPLAVLRLLCESHKHLQHRGKEANSPEL